MKRTVYLSGPIFGCDQNNFKNFQEAEEKLNALDIKCVNPHSFLERLVANTADDAEIMRARIILMMCDDITEVITLPGWETAPDASKEVQVARIMNMPVTPFVSVITQAKKADATH
jgi:hypothetical protein